MHSKKKPGRTWTADELLMKPGEEGRANENRMELLFDAADGLTTEEAVKYITHGREMMERLRGLDESLDLIKEHIPEGRCKASVAGFLLTEDTKLKATLTKLNKEGA